MSFFDELKQPAPRREEPVLTPEEAAEAEVLRRLADPEVQRVAAEMARTIRSACLEARDRGERRIYGLVTGYRDALIYKNWFWERPLWTLYFWCFTAAAFLFGSWVFHRLKIHFADVL